MLSVISMMIPVYLFLSNFLSAVCSAEMRRSSLVRCTAVRLVCTLPVPVRTSYIVGPISRFIST